MKSENQILVKVISGEFEGWGGIYNKVVSHTFAQGSVISVSIAPPPYTGRLQEVLLSRYMIRKI